MITPHRFAPEYAAQAINGIYNVQFLTFRRDQLGLKVCAGGTIAASSGATAASRTASSVTRSTSTTGRSAFEGVHVLEHKGGGLAPWNITQYEVRAIDGRVIVDDDPLVFFHYHRVRLQARGGYDWRPPGYHISRSNYRLIYEPYLRALDRATTEVRSVDPDFSAGIMPGPGPRERMGARRRLLTAALDASGRGCEARLSFRTDSVEACSGRPLACPACPWA